MKCPIDGATLAMAERHGVEIDYCPECRGIWLDRGELDRIIENASRTTRAEHPDHEQHEHEGHEDHDGYDRKRKGRLSMLGDLLGGGD